MSSTTVKPKEELILIKEKAYLEPLGISVSSIMYNEKARQTVLSDLRLALSAYAEKSTNKTYQPLEIEETLEYMPLLLKVQSDNQTFDEKVNDFWDNMTIIFDGTLEKKSLDIGYSIRKVDGKEKRSYFNLLDYVKYRWSEKHMYVLHADGMNRAIAKFRLVKESDKKLEEKNQLEREDAILSAYSGLKDLLNSGSFNKTLQVLSVNRIALNIGAVENMSKDELSISLSQLYKKNPEALIKAMEDKNLEVKSFLSALIFYGVVKQIGTSYYLDNNEIPVAQNEKAMLAYLTNPEKQLELKQWKALMETKQLTFKTK